MEKTYTWTGKNLRGEVETRTVTIPLVEMTPEERKQFDQETAEMVQRLGAYALSNPEVPVH